MTEADRAPGGPFGLVLVPLDSLLHAGGAAAQRATLEAARRAMDPRGQLVIDVFNPTPEALSALERGVVHEGSWELPDGTRVDKFGARRIHPAGQPYVQYPHPFPHLPKSRPHFADSTQCVSMHLPHFPLFLKVLLEVHKCRPLHP